MTTKYRTKGFVYKKNERSEADRIFNVFSEDFGKLEIKGRAIRKINSKLKSGVDLFYFSEIEFIEGKNQKTLTDAVAINKFNNISCDFTKIKMAFQVAEVLDNFLKGHGKDENTFNLLEKTFERINNRAAIKNFDLIYYYFLWNFLANQGYKPEVLKCAGCGSRLNPYNIYFSCKEGGVICKDCYNMDERPEKINSDIVKILRIILAKDWQTLSKLKIEPPSQALFKKVSENALLNFCPV